MDDKAEECPVCWTPFGEAEGGAEGRPRSLPCGHTFCALCISNVMRRNAVSCPSCRTRHAIPLGEHFPVNHALESVIRSQKDKSGEKQSALEQFELDSEKSRRCLSRKLCAVLQEQEGRLQDAIEVRQDVQTQLDPYHTSLETRLAQHLCLEERLIDVLDVVWSARRALQQEWCQVRARKQQAQQTEQRLHELLDSLSRVTTEEECWETQTNQTTSQANQAMHQWMRTLPTTDTVAAARKVSDAAQQAVGDLNTFLAGLHPRFPRGVPDGQDCDTIMDRLNTMLNEVVMPNTQQPSRPQRVTRPVVQAPVAQAKTQQLVHNRASGRLTLTEEQMLEAREMFRTSNKASRAHKALIVGFMAGSRENPCPHLGNIVAIKLSEREENVALPDGRMRLMMAETLFQMNYSTGQWKKVRRYRHLTSD